MTGTSWFWKLDGNGGIVVSVSWKCLLKEKEYQFKGGRMGRSDMVSLWCVSLLINTRFRFFSLG